MRKVKLFSLFLCLCVGLGQMWGVTIKGAAYQGKGGSWGEKQLPYLNKKRMKK